jgi:predicted permease
MGLDNLISQMLVLFLIMLVGFCANRIGVMDGVTNRKLATLVLNVTLPATILSSSIVEGETMSSGQLVALLGAAFLCYVIFIAVSLAVPRLMGVAPECRGVYSFMMIFSNSLFLGIPVASALFGEIAVFYAALINIPFCLLLYTLGVALVAKKDPGTTRKFQWKLLFNPGAVAALLGLVLYALRVPVPGVLQETLSVLGKITTPGAMLIIGSTLAGIAAKNLFNDPKLYIACGVRLILFPALIRFAMAPLISDPAVLGTLVALAATPVGTNTTMVCMEYGGDYETASRGVFLSTLLSMVTMPVMIWLLL